VPEYIQCLNAVAFWLAALIGGFTSEAASSCVITAGSSGGVFGLLGVFLADAVLNFSSVSYPVYRLFVLLVFSILWLFSAFNSDVGETSHSSHIAGVVVGIVMGALYLPSLPLEWMEAMAPLVGALQAACRVPGCGVSTLVANPQS
jgi:membrane associated rhomboid family serine protease